MTSRAQVTLPERQPDELRMFTDQPAAVGLMYAALEANRLRQCQQSGQVKGQSALSWLLTLGKLNPASKGTRAGPGFSAGPKGKEQEAEATGHLGHLGHKGFELKNLQPVRNSPAIIAGRPFSGHALDQMQNRGIMPSAVENAIQTGTNFPGNTPGTIGYFDAVNKIRVIVNSQTGNVITVIRGGQ